MGVKSSELDVTSDVFNPLKALQSNLSLPFPKAKTYNNLAEYYVYTFEPKQLHNHSQSASNSKQNEFLPTRNYAWYYSTLGLDYFEYEEATSNRENKYFKRRTKPYTSDSREKGKFCSKSPEVNQRGTANKFKSYSPLKSSKVIFTKPSKYGSYKKYLSFGKRYLENESKKNNKKTDQLMNTSESELLVESKKNDKKVDNVMNTTEKVLFFESKKNDRKVDTEKELLVESKKTDEKVDNLMNTSEKELLVESKKDKKADNLINISLKELHVDGCPKIASNSKVTKSQEVYSREVNCNEELQSCKAGSSKKQDFRTSTVVPNSDLLVVETTGINFSNTNSSDKNQHFANFSSANVVSEELLAKNIQEFIINARLKSDQSKKQAQKNANSSSVGQRPVMSSNKVGTKRKSQTDVSVKVNETDINSKQFTVKTSSTVPKIKSKCIVNDENKKSVVAKIDKNVIKKPLRENVNPMFKEYGVVVTNRSTLQGYKIPLKRKVLSEIAN